MVCSPHPSHFRVFLTFCKQNLRRMALWWSCCPDLCNLQGFWKQLCSRLGSKIYEHVSQRVETSQFSFQKIIGVSHFINKTGSKGRVGMEWSSYPHCFFQEKFRRSPSHLKKIHIEHAGSADFDFWKISHLQPLEWLQVAAKCSHSSGRKWPQVAVTEPCTSWCNHRHVAGHTCFCSASFARCMTGASLCCCSSRVGSLTQG